MFFVGIHLNRNGFAFCQTQCSFERFGDTLFHVLLDFNAVNHHFNIVFGGFGQLWQGIYFINLAIYTQAHKTLRFQLFK